MHEKMNQSYCFKLLLWATLIGKQSISIRQNNYLFFICFFNFCCFFVLAHVTSFAWKKCTYWFKQFYVQTAFFNRIFNDFWVTFVGWYSSAKTCLCCSKIANKLCNAMDSIMDMYYHRYLAIMFILGMYPNHYLVEK